MVAETHCDHRTLWTFQPLTGLNLFAAEQLAHALPWTAGTDVL